MRKVINLTMVGVLAMGLGITLSGCSDESKTESTVTQKGPGGTTTEKDTKSIKQSGDNPPAPTKSTP
jgi:uncharacterized lipoprotein YehR (DUF1307 family)